MKLTDIFILESWENKFADIQKSIQHMTLAQVRRHLKSEHNTDIGFTQAKPLVGMPIAQSAKAISGSIFMTISGSFDEKTQVKTIKMFFSVLRHEMSHTKQPQADEYSTPESLTDVQGYMKYITQSHERSQQVVDTIESISDYGMTLKDFDNIVDKVRDKLIAGGGVEDAGGEVYRYTIDFKSKSKSNDRIHAQEKLQQAAIALAAASLSKNKKYKAQANEFRKSLFKRFKSVSAYAKSNRDIPDGNTPVDSANDTEKDFLSKIIEDCKAMSSFGEMAISNGSFTPEQFREKMTERLMSSQDIKRFYNTMKKGQTPLAVKFPTLELLIKEMLSRHLKIPQADSK